MGRAFSVPPATLQSAQAGNANGSTYDMAGLGAIGCQVIGTFTGTVNFEISLDGGTTYTALFMTNLATGVGASTATAAGTFAANVAGVNGLFRTRTSGMSAGSVSTVVTGSPTPR